MTNNEFIIRFVSGRCGSNTEAHGHLGIVNGNTLVNYSTVLCVIDRDNKKAKFNIKKYSRTTGKIQTMIRYQLSCYGFEVEEYEGPDAYIWNCVYCGAFNLRKKDLI